MEYNQKKELNDYTYLKLAHFCKSTILQYTLKNCEQFPPRKTPEEFGGRHVWENLDERTSKEFLYLNLAGILNLSKIISKRISHSQVIKVKPGVNRSLRVTWRIPFGRTCDHRAQEAVVSSHPASLTFSVVCLSLLPQLGARYFPT